MARSTDGVETRVMVKRSLTPEERSVLRERIDRARREAENLVRTGEGERRCFTCRSVKPLDEFCKSKSKPNGRAYQCRVCKRAYVKAHEKQIRIDGGPAYEALKKRRTEAARRHRARKLTRPQGATTSRGGV